MTSTITGAVGRLDGAPEPQAYIVATLAGTGENLAVLAGGPVDRQADVAGVVHTSDLTGLACPRTAPTASRSRYRCTWRCHSSVGGCGRSSQLGVNALAASRRSQPIGARQIDQGDRDAFSRSQRARYAGY